MTERRLESLTASVPMLGAIHECAVPHHHDVNRVGVETKVYLFRIAHTNTARTRALNKVAVHDHFVVFGVDGVTRGDSRFITTSLRCSIAGKLQLLDDGIYESEGVESSVALMPWGGSKGSAREAYMQLIESGEDLAWYYTMYLNPLPPKMLSELRQKELVLVPELNYLGQFSSVLRSQGVKAESITQYTGLPFKMNDLVTKISDVLALVRKESIVI